MSNNFKPGQYVRVRSDEDEPWQDIRIYVQKQGSLHYVTKAGEVRHVDGDDTEGFLYCEQWEPEVDELVLWQVAVKGYMPAIAGRKDGAWFFIRLVHRTDLERARINKIIPYYLPPFKP